MIGGRELVEQRRHVQDARPMEPLVPVEGTDFRPETAHHEVLEDPGGHFRRTPSKPEPERRRRTAVSVGHGPAPAVLRPGQRSSPPTGRAIRPVRGRSGSRREDPAPVPPARSKGGKLLPDSLCLRLSGESRAPATAIDVERN